MYSARTHSRIVEISFGILKAPIEVTDELDRRNNGRGRLGTKTSQFRNQAKSLSLGVRNFVHVHLCTSCVPPVHTMYTLNQWYADLLSRNVWLS